MNPSLHPIHLLRRLRRARQLRRGCGDALPAWALTEVSFSRAQASWLQRCLCGWHAVPVRAAMAGAGQAVPLAVLVDTLAEQGVQLRACRLADARGLARGDVLMLADAAAQRLFGAASAPGGGMALVIDAGEHNVRLSPALAANAVSCRTADLHGALAGWVLRSQLHPAWRPARPGWGEQLGAAA
jgi:hypothetical protein